MKLIVPIILMLVCTTHGAWTTWLPSELNIGNSYITSMAIQFDSIVWAATSENGVLVKTDSVWEQLQKASTPLANDNVHIICIGADGAGGIWFGTSDGATVLKPDSSWETIDTSDGMPSAMVEALVIDRNGNKWFGTPGGIVKYDDTDLTVYDIDSGVTSDRISALAVDEANNIWAATSIGLLKYDGSDWTMFDTDDGLHNTWLRNIFIDADGLIWLATNDGIATFDGVSEFSRIDDPDSLATNVFYSITQDAAGYYWMGTLMNGVLRYDGEAFVRYDTIDGLAGGTVRAIAVSSLHERWIGTDNGISRYTNTAPAFSSANNDTTIYTGEACTYTVAASDIDTDPIRYTLLDGPAGTVLDSLTGELAWTPALEDTGEHPVIIQISDPFDGSTPDTVVLTVQTALVSVCTKQETRPAVFALHDAQPNPCNPSTNISFSLATAAPTLIAVYDMRGKLVKQLTNRVLPAGTHTAFWNGMNSVNAPVVSGTYIYRIVSGTFYRTKKVTVYK